MRKIETVIIVIFVISLVTLASSVAAQNYDLTVEGQNNPEQDIKAIQEAVDKGGVILLRGMFDLGDKGRVNFKKDVKVVGEMDNEKNPLTKIKEVFGASTAHFHRRNPRQKNQGPKLPYKEFTLTVRCGPQYFWLIQVAQIYPIIKLQTLYLSR